MEKNSYELAGIGWHKYEKPIMGRWIDGRNESSLKFSVDKERIIEVGFEAVSFRTPKTLSVVHRDKVVSSEEIFPDKGLRKIDFTIIAGKGVNKLSFVVVGGAERPCDHNANSADSRYLSVKIRNLIITERVEIRVI